MIRKLTIYEKETMHDPAIQAQNTASNLRLLSTLQEGSINKGWASTHSLFFHDNVCGFRIKFEQFLSQVQRSSRETKFDNLTLCFQTDLPF